MPRQKSIALELSCEWNNENEVEMNSDEHLIFMSQENNCQKKITKNLIPSNCA